VRSVRWTTAAVTVIALAAVPPAQAYERPGVTRLVSAAANGSPGNGSSPGNGFDGYGPNVAGEVSMTPDGRYIAFSSAASNLVPHDTDGVSDVFVRDRSTGQIQRVSVATGGAQGSCVLRTASQDTTLALGSCGAWSPTISSDGRYVAFSSSFPNLVPGTVYTGTQVFVHDRRTDTTSLVSVDKDGHPAVAPEFLIDQEYPAISSTGRYVVFTSNAPNLDLGVPGCGGYQVPVLGCTSTSLAMRVYLRDLVAHTTKLVSVGAQGSADGNSYALAISPDGRDVLFSSDADNLGASPTVPSPFSGCVPTSDYPTTMYQVYVRELAVGRTQLVSVGIDGKAGDACSGYFAGSSDMERISADDRYVVFDSSASNLVPNPPAPAGIPGPGSYVRDLKSQRTELVTVDSVGVGVGQKAWQLSSISPDGRYTSYTEVIYCPGSNYGLTGYWNVQVMEYDSLTGAQEEVSVAANGTELRSCPNSTDATAADSVISSGGGDVAFTSNFNDLVRGQQSSQYSQVYVRDRGLDLGVGGLAGSGVLRVAGVPGFASTGLVSAADPVGEVNTALSAVGAKLIQASLAYRPSYQDLFVRVGVQQMPTFLLASPAIVYGLNVTVNRVHYQVRVAKTDPVDDSFSLFRRSAGGTWTQVATLKGGYGTTGEEVVFALPLRDLGLQGGGRLSGLQAFTGVGSYLTGAAQVVDEIALSQ